MKNLLLLSVFFLCGCTSAAKVHHVEIIKKKYIPKEITINAGDTVVWTNKEKRQYHNVWFKQSTAKEPEYMFPGDTFEMTFDSTGEHPYECGPHPKMKGKVLVK